MRILQVRFKNLNSLAGEWLIDFTHPAFISDGIFAITGPTGAGKTSLLDAICLGLYGRTPRLNRVSKGANEIMSRQTGECFAEVTFETQAGTFRCHWSQHRSRRKSDGELQAPKHEIANALTGEIFESKLRGVADQIEAATGMDFDRFTRSMLLAQGGFAAFLQAAADERAPILEQITGTEIYSQISVRVHELQRVEQEKLKVLQAETAGIQLLSLEEENTLELQVSSLEQDEKRLREGVVEVVQAVDWLNRIQSLNERLKTIAEQEVQWQLAFDQFEPDRVKLVKAQAAASLEGQYATLQGVRDEQCKDQKMLAEYQEALPSLNDALNSHKNAHHETEQKLVRHKTTLNEEWPLIQRIRQIDQQINASNQQIQELDLQYKSVLSKVDEGQQASKQQQTLLDTAKHQLEAVHQYREKHAADEWLVSGLTGIEQQLNGLLAQHEGMAEQVMAHSAAQRFAGDAEKVYQQCLKNVELRHASLDHVNKQLQQARSDLATLLDGKLLREYRQEKETLFREMAFLKKIAALEEHRAKLEEGQPCPLCGAKEHPFAEGNVPAVDAVEERIQFLEPLITSAENKEAEIKAREHEETQARATLMESQHQLQLAEVDKRSAEKACVELSEALAVNREQLLEQQTKVLAQLKPLGISSIDQVEIRQQLNVLKTRLDQWQQQDVLQSKLEKEIYDLQSKIQSQKAIIETQQTVLLEKQQARERINITRDELLSERSERYGDRVPDIEEQRLQDTVRFAESAEKAARDKYAETADRFGRLQAQIETLQKDTEQREKELAVLDVEFTHALQSQNFADETAYLNARLSISERNAWSEKAQALDAQNTQIQTRKEDCRQRLAEEKAKQLTDQPIEVLQAQLDEQTKALHVLSERLVTSRHRLRENAAAKLRIQDKQQAIEAQQVECRRWGNLHQLIGSSDGKKYRNFAQGLTFEMMIVYANRQLQKMTDRYLLVRDAMQPLELNVLDNYQAGEIRSTKNLSGGESFIVSLSLALGLSQMASKNVRVDSLFLDEGFGTLDEEALETALETLSSLHQDGKMIGIISHVAALKERISTQINVIPQTGGRSRIVGAGCKHLS
ncbi:SbcC/MukB-like Walker B domain-containing protein [Nitrincola nitratireducens]|uniref:Nuclease sbcCD subunit C n=1 Tax=Nitrincola nitratireducens TaxID=1229521 RepID=W9VI20_9GAMM|nr:AAA family ATPase [Nitrincola nitratireducens]EXJ10250.1 Nuclease sbcCD subunit C [Nitrincola nitratireducens]